MSTRVIAALVAAGLLTTASPASTARFQAARTEASSSRDSAFRDVPVRAWFTSYVAAVFKAGYITGYRDQRGRPTGEFGPSDSVTYGQLAKIAVLAARPPLLADAQPRNRSARFHWSREYVAAAEKIGLSVFIANLHMDAPATRGAVVQTLVEAMSVAPAPHDRSFRDVPPRHPHAAAIAAAKKAGWVQGDTGQTASAAGLFRPNDPINRAELAKLLSIAAGLASSNSSGQPVAAPPSSSSSAPSHPAPDEPPTPRSRGGGGGGNRTSGEVAASTTSSTASSDAADTTAPTITNVTSDKTNGSYTVGTIIDINMTFSENVTSTEDVTVTLETEDTDRSCTFTVSNSSTGTCNYSVQAGDTSGDLTVKSIAGTIADQAGNPMTNFVPATNLAANKAIVIDTSGPTLAQVTPVSTPTNDNTPSYTFSTTEAGTVAYGGDCSSVTSSATSGNNTVVFALLGDGAHSNCTITVTDAAGNGSDPLSITSFTVDTQAPTVSLTAPAASSTATGGTIITFTDDEETSPECSVDGSTWTACVSASTTLADITGWSSVSTGSTFTLSLRDIDPAGNTGTDTNTNITKAATAIATYLLNEQAGAYAAFGLRKLSSAYDGNAIEVRRASDDTTTTVGFTATGALDTATLVSYCAGTDCHVKTWYDQSGSGANLTQATASKQPKIVSAGTVLRDTRGLPRMQFVGSAVQALSTSTLATSVNNQDLTAFFMQQAEYAGSYKTILALGVPSYATLEYNYASKQGSMWIGDGATYTNAETANTTQSAWRTIQVLSSTGQTVQFFRNRSLFSTATHAKSASTVSALTIGSRAGGSLPYDGYVSEAVLYPALATGARLTAYDDINDYYRTGPTTVNTGALLAQDWQYQVDLYDWLETITEADVTTSPGTLTWDGTYADDDTLGYLWLGVGNSGQEYVDTKILRAEPKWFVLDDGNGAGIEGAGAVKVFDYPATAALWYSANLSLSGGGQGNPYYHDPAVCRRAMVSAAVDLMKHDALQDSSPGYWSLVDFAGGSMNGWMWAYSQCEDVLPTATQEAFKDAFAYMAWKFLQWGAHDINDNMDTKAIAALAHAYVILDDPTEKDWTVRAAKKILFGSETGTPATTNSGTGIYHLAGYIGEADGPETTYNGASLFYLQEAQAVTRDEAAWDFMDEVVQSMVDFKVHQYFRDPDGYFDGPAGYANRTGDSYVYDQRNKLWRDITAAATFTEGRPLARNARTSGAPDAVVSTGSMVTSIQTGVTYFNTNDIGTSTGAVAPTWGENHWPADNLYTPATGWHSSLKTLLDADDTTTLYPFERAADINESFDDEFWAYKDHKDGDDFGFFVESDTRPGPYDGWYGGSLQTFWTESGGMLIMSKHDKTGCDAADNENTRCWDEIDQWATHHVWGRDEAGSGFTIATTDGYNHAVTYNLAGAPPTVEVTTSIGTGSAKGMEEAGVLTGTVVFTNRFEALTGTGVKITHTITSDQADQITELWATLPVYLRDNGAQSGLTDTAIQYWDGTTWQSLSTSIVSTQYIRLLRDFGSGRTGTGWIVFDESRRVELSSAVWQADYQSANRFRNIHIDLHGNPGTPITFPASTTLSFTIQTVDPGLLPIGATITFSYPEEGDRIPVGGVWAAKATISSWGGGGAGTAYVDYSTNTGSTWTSLSAMSDNGDGTYQYVGGTIPSGVTTMRIRAVDGLSNETAVSRTVPSVAATRVFYDQFTTASGTVIDGTYNAWDVNTTGNAYSLLRGTMKVNTAGRAIGTTAPDGWTNTVAINGGSANVIIKGILNRQNATSDGEAALIGRASNYYTFIGANVSTTSFYIHRRANGVAAIQSHTYAINPTADYIVHLQISGKVAVATFYDGESRVADRALFGIPNTATQHGFKLGDTKILGDNFEIYTF